METTHSLLPSEGTSPRSSPPHVVPLDNTLSSHFLAPIASPSALAPVHGIHSPHHVAPSGISLSHVPLVDHYEELPSSPLAHHLIPTCLPSDGRSLGRSAARSHA